MHPFPTPWKHQKNRKVFWCFQGVEKGCIGNEWIKLLISPTFLMLNCMAYQMCSHISVTLALRHFTLFNLAVKLMPWIFRNFSHKYLSQIVKKYLIYVSVRIYLSTELIYYCNTWQDFISKCVSYSKSAGRF